MSIEILKETGALLEGHFLLSSGRHSDRYAQNAKLLQYPDKAAEVLSVVAEKVKDLDIDVVCGPAMGGIIVAYELGRQLGKRAIFTERENNVMTLRRGFEIQKGEKVLITEDVVTTCIVGRAVNEIFCPVYSAMQLEIATYEADECPLCKAGIPLVKPGSRKFDK